VYESIKLSQYDIESNVHISTKVRLFNGLTVFLQYSTGLHTYLLDLKFTQIDRQGLGELHIHTLIQ